MQLDKWKLYVYLHREQKLAQYIFLINFIVLYIKYFYIFLFYIFLFNTIIVFIYK
jgi:hypothetical protein